MQISMNSRKKKLWPTVIGLLCGLHPTLFGLLCWTTNERQVVIKECSYTIIPSPRLVCLARGKKNSSDSVKFNYNSVQTPPPFCEEPRQGPTRQYMQYTGNTFNGCSSHWQQDLLRTQALALMTWHLQINQSYAHTYSRRILVDVYSDTWHQRKCRVGQHRITGSPEAWRKILCPGSVYVVIMYTCFEAYFGQHNIIQIFLNKKTKLEKRSIKPTPKIITLVTSITMFYGSDNVLQNIPILNLNVENIPWNTVSPIIIFLWI